MCIRDRSLDIDVLIDAKTGVGGFDLLMDYDGAALAILDVNTNNSVLYNDCGWEYFQYRYGPFGNCDGDCPSGQVRVVGLAEINNGDVHPSCFNTNAESVLFTVKFLVTNDHDYNAAFVPIRFYWYDCGDNVFSNELGMEIYLSENVYDVDPNGGWVNLTPLDRLSLIHI